MPFTGLRRLTGEKTAKKRRVSDARLLDLETLQEEKKRANKDVKQRKDLLLQRKKKLNRMRFVGTKPDLGDWNQTSWITDLGDIVCWYHQSYLGGIYHLNMGSCKV